MDTIKRDYVKANLSPLNKILNKHGGLENKIKLTKLKTDQIDFLYELMTQHMEEYIEYAREEIFDFHREELQRYLDMPQYKNWQLPVEIHGIKLPEKFEEGCEWELQIGRTWFGGTQMGLMMKGWEIDDQYIV
ncbi:hypothetical protein OGH69_04095 [Flavobacterium sp. MFBS3-15]|uniref:hypothetical protein n=1 Tax=Flavobacterium sp. MFBS3-15 TaxID=2989816 RepID=UPI0022359AE8|nr:hypothetical protein [Flavobacterium sp. MFBS3-15]MCW4468137.1 hypothetical protein [Flavobacterium sp. MFBS3-15]